MVEKFFLKELFLLVEWFAHYQNENFIILYHILGGLHEVHLYSHGLSKVRIFKEEI